MTVYFSERTFTNEIVDFLQKNFPRGEISSNYLKISRASTIDYKLLLKYFTCALAREHDFYQAAITLPEDLQGKIPGWYAVRNDKEIFVDSTSGPDGQNVYNENVFVLRFNFFVKEEIIHKIPDTKEASTEDTLTGQLLEIRHALIDGIYEPLEILREFYQEGEITVSPKFSTSKYLSDILDFPH